MDSPKAPKPNALDRASSPYLRQHRLNPVHWVEYDDTLFEQAHQIRVVYVIEDQKPGIHG